MVSISVVSSAALSSALEAKPNLGISQTQLRPWQLAHRIKGDKLILKEPPTKEEE